MTHLQTKLIAIKRIDCSYSADYFGYTQSQIDRGAELFLVAKGLINPLVVRRTNNVSEGITIDDATPHGRYELVSGYLEYFCALRANEIQPTQEWIQAIIVDSSLDKNLTEQIELFRIREAIFSDDDDLDFELEEEIDIDLWIDEALEGKSVEDCFAAARKVCNLYPDPADRANAIAELETLKEQASGDISARAKLDKFFAE